MFTLCGVDDIRWPVVLAKACEVDRSGSVLRPAREIRPKMVSYPLAKLLDCWPLSGVSPQEAGLWLISLLACQAGEVRRRGPHTVVA
jgi:hypothetical protein